MIDARTKSLSLIANILFCVCVLGSLAGCNQETTIDQAARRVKVTPTLTGLEGYIVKSVKPGMSREQVEQALSAIGPVEVKRGSLEDVGAGWGPGACDDISLILHPLKLQVWLIIACYNTQGQLVALHSADPDYPQISIYAPLQK